MGLRTPIYIESVRDTTSPTHRTNGPTSQTQRSPYLRRHRPQRARSPASIYISPTPSTSTSSKRKRFLTFACNNCRNHLSTSTNIVSKDYRGRTGDAYLMSNVINVIDGRQELRAMITGDYVVCNIYCHWCKSLIGWKYIRSDSRDQAYKEGMFILELKKICVVD